MKISPEQQIECPQCGVTAGAFCKGKRGRRMQTTHTRRKQLWKIRNGLATKVKVAGRGQPFVVPIYLTHDVCARCSQPRNLHVAVNYSNVYSMGAVAVLICPTSTFKSQLDT